MTHEELIEMHRVSTEANDRSKSNTHRIDRLEERQDNLDKLVTSVAVMAEKQENMSEAVEEIKTTVKSMASSADVATVKEDVENLKAKPAKRWESVIDKVILVLVGAIAAYAVSKLGF